MTSFRGGGKHEPGRGAGLVLEARGLVKHYGVVIALAGADFDLYPGEILALIGDNGAGKSTLIKALSGAIVPDRGEILLAARRVHVCNPLEARRSVIETVYEDLALAPALTSPRTSFLGANCAGGTSSGSCFG